MSWFDSSKHGKGDDISARKKRARDAEAAGKKQQADAIKKQLARKKKPAATQAQNEKKAQAKKKQSAKGKKPKKGGWFGN